MTEYRNLIESTALQFKLDPDLVEAVVLTESSGHTDAFRFEPAFFDRYLKDKFPFSGGIKRRVSSSYGLMQVMYSTAYGYGYRQIPEYLFNPDTGLYMGCLHLSKMLEWAKGDSHKALAAYNGGQGNWDAPDPQNYADKVTNTCNNIKKARLE